MKSKRCSCCKQEKPLSDFGVDNRNKDGIHRVCKVCLHERSVAKTPPEKRRTYFYAENGVKKCYKCGETKPISEFHTAIGNKDGLLSYCKKCRNAQHNINYSKHIVKRRQHDHERDTVRKKLLYDLKQPCLNCGESDPTCVDFHHIDPSKKKFNIAGACVKHKPMEEIKEEIKKCVCLCSNCHKKFHAYKWKYEDSKIKKE